MNNRTQQKYDASVRAAVKATQGVRGDDRCKSCGVLFSRHDGISATCATAREACKEIAELRAALSASPAAQPVEMPECVWHEDDDGLWQSSCGGDPWCFNDDGPERNGMKHCHKCGARLTVAASPRKAGTEGGGK